MPYAESNDNNCGLTRLVSMSKRKLLIVNADDFGYYKAADEGIVKAVNQGIVTSATVVVNMPRAENLPHIVKEMPELLLGIHFNLTHGKPVCSRVPSLVDGKGMFCHTAEALALKASAEDIALELEAQLMYFNEIFGKPPSHIDSHKHIHRKTNILKAVVSGARKQKLPVRSNSPYVHYSLKNAGVATTDFFIGDVSVGPFWTKEKLYETLRHLSEGVTELMCHPGYVDKHGDYIGFYNAQREGELVSLCDKEILQVLKEEDIQLVNFSRLTGLSL